MKGAARIATRATLALGATLASATASRAEQAPVAPPPAPAAAPVRFGVIVGVVVDDRGAPQAGVTVIAGDQLVLTDEGGRFELRLPAGAVTLELSAPWLAPRTITERLAPGARRPARYVLRAAEVAPDGGGEVVEIEDRAPIEPGRQRIEASVARTVPGTSGDVLKVVESLAGVARPAPGKAELVVWGAAPKDTQVLIDGVPVPSLYHAGGWRAALGGELVTNLVLEPGAFGPRYGGAIGGIIAVTTEAPAGDGVTLAADVLDAGGAIHRQLGQTRLAATGRWSYLDRIITATSDATEGDAGELVPVPAWGDVSAIAQTPVADGEGRLFALGSRDRLTRTVDSDDPAARKEQRLANDVLRAGAGWRGPAAGGSAQLTFYLGRDEERTALRFGEVPANLRTERWLAGARAEQVHALAEIPAVLTLGAEVSLARDDVHRDGSLGTPAREGDVAIFGQPPGDDVASDDWIATTGTLAIHGALDWIHDRWTLSPGLRLDGIFVGASRLTPKIGRTPEVGYQHITLEPQPRLAARYRDGDAAFSVEGGLYAQPRQGADASAVFGTPSLGVEHAVHVAIGGAYRLGPLSLEATAYARALYDLVARHPSATPPATGALTQDGEGTVLGGQLVLKLAPWKHLTGWLSYGLSRSARKDAASIDERRFDHDQPHLITLVAGWQRGRWSLGTRVRVASGEPRTEVIGAFVDARSGRYQPILGEHNGLRLPVFAQLDARAERQLDLGGGEFALYLEVQNVSSRRNAEEIVYSADYGDRGYLTGLPVLAVLGARWQR